MACPAAAVADPPPVTITRGPAGPTNNPTPEFVFHTDDAVAVLTCRLDGPVGAAGTELPCASPDRLGPLADGDYVFVVRATDPDPLIGSGVAQHEFTVDTTAPETTIDGASAGGGSAAFRLSASETGATFECSLAGPGRDASFAACDGAPAYAGLPDGDYTFAARAVDAAGNVDATPATRPFSLVTPPPPAATPRPAPPVPRLHATVVVRPGLADVRVRPPGVAAFVPLTGDRALPVGTLIDARRGSVQLVTAPKLQHATFTGAVFRVTQPGRQTVLTLVPSGCRAVQLAGDGRGAFEVRGRYSTATVRAGRWTVRDSCAGTLTRALRGLAQVRDTARHRTLLLRAGRAYLARRAN